MLLLGPSQAKHERKAFLAAHKPELHHRVLGIENADHPTDGQLAARGRAFFAKADAMLGGPRVSQR